jgi:nucleotide-binding universal stress UspA family protein
MLTPTSILVIARGDGRDQAAIEMASRLASHYGARIVVATVLGSLPRAFQRISLVIDPVELWKMAALEHARYLDTLVGGEAMPIRIETRVLFGRKVEQIVREVSREKHDLLIVPGSFWTRHLPTWIRFDLRGVAGALCGLPNPTLAIGSGGGAASTPLWRTDRFVCVLSQSELLHSID